MKLKFDKILTNRYFLVLMVFCAWMLFFDENNWIRHWHLSRELNEAREQKRFYREEFIKDSILLRQIETDLETKEKLARENYLMKKDDETIYVIVREDEE
ncbi:MAG: FtsB family cell division protein [Bacteroidales bacterium]